MTDEPFTYEMFEETRFEILNQILKTFTTEDKEFLFSFMNGNPLWNDKSWAKFPGIKWKLLNINKLKSTNPDKHINQQKELEILFSL
jgi:hypothetical protein